jgi:hypothetical protein
MVAICGCHNLANNRAQVETATITLAPPSGEGRSGIFTVNMSSADKLALIGLLYNAGLDGGHACYVFYNPAVSGFSLVKDSGSGADPLIKGEPFVQNSQCALANTDNTRAEIWNNVLVIHLAITFKPQFAGPRNAYVYASYKDGREPTMQQEGTWLVAP